MTAPRCREPVEYYELAGRPRTDVFPVCWRPAGHRGTRHLSEYAWRAMLERNRRRRRNQRQGASRVLSDPPLSVAA